MFTSVPTVGFIFREQKKDRNIRKDVIARLDIPVSELAKIKKGADFTTERGVVIKNEELTIKPASPKAFAYCTDTMYSETLIPYVQGCDLLYHEATFMEDKAQDAREKMHSHSKRSGHRCAESPC